VRFKYPPIIRKIMDLSRAIRRARNPAKIHAQKVMAREEHIFSEYAKILNDYSFLQTRAKVIGGLAKAEKEKGKENVALAPTDTLADEYAMAKEQREVEINVKSAVPAKLPKEGPKKGKKIKGEEPAPARAAAPVTVVKAVAEEEGEKGAPAAPSLPKKPSITPAPANAAQKAPTPESLGMPRTAEEVGGQEGLYGELVRLEQKRAKAQRSIHDLKAKKENGILSNEEYDEYMGKFEEVLNSITERIDSIRRKLVNV
jgi:hypothetical protein